MNRDALERARRRALEVHAPERIAAESRSVTRTLELVLGRQPARRASEMRADRKQTDERSIRLADNPDPLLVLELFADRARNEVVRESSLEDRRLLVDHS